MLEAENDKSFQELEKQSSCGYQNFGLVDPEKCIDHLEFPPSLQVEAVSAPGRDGVAVGAIRRSSVIGQGIKKEGHHNQEAAQEDPFEIDVGGHVWREGMVLCGQAKCCERTLRE